MDGDGGYAFEENCWFCMLTEIDGLNEIGMEYRSTTSHLLLPQL